MLYGECLLVSASASAVSKGGTCYRRPPTSTANEQTSEAPPLGLHLASIRAGMTEPPSLSHPDMDNLHFQSYQLPTAAKLHSRRLWIPASTTRRMRRLPVIPDLT